MVSYAVSVDGNSPSFNYYTDLEFAKELRLAFAKAKLLVGFNIKYDLHWARRGFGLTVPQGCRVWDCQIAEFLLRGQQGAYPSLDEALQRFDLGQKDDKIAAYWALGVDTQDIPVDELQFYNNLDVELTYKLYQAQQKVLPDKLKRLCLVMGLDLLVLAEMEWNGVKFDIEECEKQAKLTKEKLDEITEELLAYAPTPDINLDSGQQLSCMLYGGEFELEYLEPEELVYKSGPKKGQTYTRNKHTFKRFKCEPLFVPVKGTETKTPVKLDGVEIPVFQTGEDVLKRLRAPSKQHKRIIELLLARAEYAKLLDTYYGKIPQLLEQMEWGEYLHGQYNQVVAATGRLSSSNPNMQNFSGDVDELLVSRYV